MRPLLLALTLVGCARTEPADDITRPSVDEPTPEAPAAIQGSRSRSGAVVVAKDPLLTFVADPDNGAVQVFRRGDGTFTPFSLGANSEPTRMVRIGDDLFVTLRNAGQLAHLRWTPDGLVEVGRVNVGAEPFDVVASPTRARLFVSLSTEDAVVELDAATLTPVRRIEVAGEPRWMAVQVNGGVEQLAVASLRGATVTVIDVSSLAREVRTLPDRRRFANEACDDRLLVPRVSGEIAFDPAGNLFVPSMYVDTLISTRAGDGPPPGLGDEIHGDTGIDEPCDEDPPDPNDGDPPPGEDSPYGAPVMPEDAARVSRFNPVLTVLSADGSARTVALGTLVIDMLDRQFGVARGVPSGVELFEQDDRHFAVVSFENDDAMVVLDLRAPVDEPGAGALTTVRRGAVSAGGGGLSPRLLENQGASIVSWSWMEREVGTWMARSLVEVAAGGLPFDPEATKHHAGPSLLPADILDGRRMFFSTSDRRMAAAGSGVSCSACHVDGRTDGLTWRFADFDRQTPTLAGPVYLTEPVTWTGEVDTVAREVHLTTTNRMGGEGVSFDEAATVAGYVNWSRLPNVAKGDAAQVARGEAIFRRADVGCAACHGGEQGTFGLTVSLYGLPAVNVPGLRSIAATAPYLHDGSAKTLRDVLLRARDGSMGNTGMLSDAELDDLEAFLRQF